MTQRTSIRGVVTVVLATVGTLLVFGDAGAGGRPPIKVTIRDEKPVITEVALPVDPTPRVRYTVAGLGPQIRTEQNQQLHLSHFPMLNIDGRVMQPGQAGGQFTKNNVPLGRTPGGRERQGHMSVFVIDDLRITMIAEMAPTKSTDQKKRELGTVLVRYIVENIGKQPRKFGLRNYFDMYVVTNDGAMFAAPTVPGKIIDGIELKDKTLPDYVQCLERPDLKNPGYVAHITVNLGSSIEKASRVVLTRHGAGLGGWDMPAMESMGDSAVGLFFEPKEIKPGGRREFGYAYGKGIAIAPESEGNVEVRLAGSFEPGKHFTVTALVHDPLVGQALTLDLPKGMALVEGREIQPVPQPTTDPPQSFVVWRCRVLELGEHPLRLRSSTGVTQTKLITISQAE